MTISLKLDERTITGKKVATLRKQGIVPSVVYSGDSGAASTQSEFVATKKVVEAAGKHTPVELVVGGKKQLAIIKSVDIDPAKHSLRHISFHAIKQNEKIVTEVPIELVGLGESPAEKAGLIVLQALESVEIRALPADLPESLQVSIEGLTTDEDKITIGSITLPKGVEFADIEQDLELVVANVYEPSALQAANDAAGGDADEDTEVAADNGGEAEAEGSAQDTKEESKE
jgi:large subunit ribosomal protein L25